MTARAQISYDFGRCTVEHVGPHSHSVPAYGTIMGTMSKTGVVIRVKQGHWDSADDAQFSLLEDDARGLANRILAALEDQ